MIAWWFLIAVVVISFLLTAGLRRYALVKSIIDIPNSRSSHSLPTPRGGGVAIVCTFMCSIAILCWLNGISIANATALLGAGILIAIIGFLDDHGHIAARWRLLGHFFASLWAIAWLGGMPIVRVFGLDVDLGWIGNIFALFYLVWLLNLYNFMDGIDGIASIEAVCVCVGACILYCLTDKSNLIVVPVILALAVLGFLFWNFPPAKIFMGDAGSGFLGIILGILSLQAAWISPQLFWGWLILLGVFIVDATFTLSRRIIRRDKVYEAHRSHAYQYASRVYGRHLPVTLSVLVINFIWLIPLATAMMIFNWDGAITLIVSYIPLVLIAIRFHAGELEPAT